MAYFGEEPEVGQSGSNYIIAGITKELIVLESQNYRRQQVSAIYSTCLLAKLYRTYTGGGGGNPNTRALERLQNVFYIEQASWMKFLVNYSN